MDAARKLVVDSAFVPCHAEDGDEIYPNSLSPFEESQRTCVETKTTLSAKGQSGFWAGRK